MEELKIGITSNCECNFIQDNVVKKDLEYKLAVAQKIHEDGFCKMELYIAMENAKKRWIINNVTKPSKYQLDKIISERLLYQQIKQDNI